MKNINWKNVGKKVGNVAVSVFELALIYGFLLPSPKRKADVIANYSGAVKAILNSDMLDSYKRDVMGMLKTDGNADYYETIISIANSDMLDSYKKEMIEKMSEDF